MAKKKGLRILWKSNAPHVGSGYGVQANSLLPRLAQHPNVEEIGIFGYYGIAGGICVLPVGENIPGVQSRMMAHYPVSGSDGWGNDVVWEHARHFDADVIITLMDVWVLKQDYGHGGFLWVPYAPIDHETIPPQVLDRLRQTYHPVAYSKHAAGLFAEAGLDYHYIPHGVETSIFKPYDRGGKIQAKKWLEFEPDVFLVGTVARNAGWPSRKGYPELFEAFAVFHDKHPEARLVAHTEMIDTRYSGMNLSALAKLYGIDDFVRFSRPYVNLTGFSPREMCRFYNAMDVFCLPSMGEGFGIPLIEAQACAVPVITTDWTACAELCGSGWLVRVGKKIPTLLQAFQAYADVDALIFAMEDAYRTLHNADLRESKQQRAREFAMQYDWEHLVKDMWYPFIDWLWERVQVKTLRRPAKLTLLPPEPIQALTEVGVRT